MASPHMGGPDHENRSLAQGALEDFQVGAELITSGFLLIEGYSA